MSHRTPWWMPALALLMAGCDENSARVVGVTPPDGLDYAHEEPWREGTFIPPPGPGGRILVTNSLDDTLSLVELATVGTPDFRELARVPVGLNPVELEGPHHTAVSPAGTSITSASPTTCQGVARGRMVPTARARMTATA